MIKNLNNFMININIRIIMSESKTHADNIEYGTITVIYEVNKSFFSWLFSKLSKPKNAKNIQFTFNKSKYIVDKKSISNIEYFNVVESINSPCPLIVTNNANIKNYLKIYPVIRQDNESLKLNYILLNLKMLKLHPSFPNIIYSQYNCIYRLQNQNYSVYLNNDIELACIYNGKDSMRFIFAYNNDEIKKRK